MSELELVLDLPMHKKRIRLFHSPARSIMSNVYFIQYNDNKPERITEREVEMWIKGFEIVKIHMKIPSKKAVFTKPEKPKKKKVTNHE